MGVFLQLPASKMLVFSAISLEPVKTHKFTLPMLPLRLNIFLNNLFAYLTNAASKITITPKSTLLLKMLFQ